MVHRICRIRVGRRLLALALAGLCSAPPAFALCSDRIRAATPTARFVLNADGTATDKRTGLTWMRCPLGAVLDDGGTPGVPGDDHCVPAGTRTFNWAGALVATQQLNAGGGFAGSTAWRVPNRKELLSIVETRCSGPAINVQVFPDSPVGPYYTSTTYSPAQSQAWVIDFGSGGELPEPKVSTQFLRLVRN